MLIVVIQEAHKQLRISNKQIKETRISKQQWHRAALDSCTRPIMDKISRTRSTSCHRSGSVKLAQETTLLKYFTILHRTNPRRMFPLY